MPDALSPSERALIDAALDRKRVIPRGVYTAPVYARGTHTSSSYIGREIVRPGQPEGTGEIIGGTKPNGKRPNRGNPRATISQAAREAAARRSAEKAAETRARYAVHARPDRSAAEVGRLMGVATDAARSALQRYGLPYQKFDRQGRPRA